MQSRPCAARGAIDAIACLEAGCFPEAAAALQSIANKPRYADAYFRLGIALDKLGDIRGAIVASQRTTELLPLTEAWFRAAGPQGRRPDRSCWRRMLRRRRSLPLCFLAVSGLLAFGVAVCAWRVRTSEC
jgi:hypothetical protein